jgi:hypothetical protein
MGEQEIEVGAGWVNCVDNSSFSENSEIADSGDFAGYCCIDDGGRSINES